MLNEERRQEIASALQRSKFSPRLSGKVVNLCEVLSKRTDLAEGLVDDAIAAATKATGGEKKERKPEAAKV